MELSGVGLLGGELVDRSVCCQRQGMRHVCEA